MKYGGPDAAQKVIEEATSHAAQIGAITSPAAIAAKGATAAAEEKGRAPFQQSIEMNVAGYRNRLEQGNAARERYATSQSVLNEAQATNQQFRNLLTLGQSGNAAAQDQIKASLPSLIGRVQGIKNAAAESGDKELGGIADKAIAGLTGSLRSGLQADLPAVFDTLEDAATNRHNLNVRTINSTYGPTAGVKFNEAPARPGRLQRRRDSPTSPRPKPISTRYPLARFTLIRKTARGTRNRNGQLWRHPVRFGTYRRRFLRRNPDRRARARYGTSQG